MKRSWTKKELDEFIKLYPDTLTEKLCELFNRSESALETKASKLKISKNIKADGSRYYTQYEKDYIKNNYGLKTIEEIAKVINRSASSIKSMAERIGLISNYWWTSDEESFLKEQYPNGNRQYICKELNRNWKAIRRKARKMKIKRFRENGEEYIANVPAKQKEINFIKENYKDMIVTEMARILNRSQFFVQSICDKYNLNVLKIGSFGKRCFSKNGDVCYSIPEQSITNFFIDNNIKYLKDVPYSKIISSFNKKYRTDWILFDKVIVEYFGVMGKRFYKKRQEEKKRICSRNNLSFIELFYTDINNLKDIFKNYM